MVEHRVLGLLLAAKPTSKTPRIRKTPIKSQINKLASPRRKLESIEPQFFLVSTTGARPIGSRENKSLTTGSIRRLPAKDGVEDAEVELLRVGALGAVHVHDVHGRLLRRRVLLRLGRHGCCCHCCEEEEDQERATMLEERGTCLLHRRRLRGGSRLYSRQCWWCRGGESADGGRRVVLGNSASRLFCFCLLDEVFFFRVCRKAF